MKCVYCLDFPDGKRYVGSTKNLKTRLRYHNYSYNNAKSNPDLKAAILNGYDVVILEVLPDSATKKDLFTKEQHYIDLWWDAGILYNMNKRADVPPNQKGIPKSAECIIKRSNTRKHSAWQYVSEIKKRYSAGETCAKISEDYNCSSETIRRISVS